MPQGAKRLTRMGSWRRKGAAWRERSILHAADWQRIGRARCEEWQMRWSGRLGKRTALVALAVAVVVGASYWAYASFRNDYHLRSAIQLDSVAMTGGGSGWAVGE